MGSQGAHPACLFLSLTILVAGTATVLLSTAVLTDHWEVVTVDRTIVEIIVAKHNSTYALSWLYGGRVAKVMDNIYIDLKSIHWFYRISIKKILENTSQSAESIRRN